MKKLLLLVIATGALSACAPVPAPPAPVDHTADEAKLKADALAWFDFYNKGDADGVTNLYAEDAVLMPPNVPMASGRAAIRTFIAGDIAASKAGGITLNNASITGTGVHGDLGWISGTFVVLDATGKTIDTGKYLSIHKHANGSWPYIRDIWNSDNPAPPPPPPAKVIK